VEGASNEVEEAMKRIWEEVLGVKGIGIHDNFFELGGDSILGIQVVSRANNLGLQLYPDQLFKHETIAELAAVVGITNVVQAEQGDVTGYIPLTPIQRWFFEQNNPEPHYYNQAMMLEIDQKVDGQIMASVIKALIKHHDILRVRFERVRTDWQQFNAPPDDTAPLIEADLSLLENMAQERAVQTAAAALQSNLDLENGPLMRAGLFKLGEEKPTLLMIVIHHLAVDGVSWRILLEDLQFAFEQASQLQGIDLPAKTTSFKEWAERLQENAYSSRIDQELDYWLNQDWSSAEPIPADFAREPGTTPSERVVTVKLSQEETSSLLLTVPKAFGARIDEILLAALAEAFARWSEREKIIIFLEGHGRESLFEGIDLSRTVGWFTTLYPILLDLKRADNSIDALDLVKRQLQSLPDNGIAYGILRHLRDDTSKQLKQVITGEVVFNYLGQLDQFTRKENTFRAGRWSVGPSHSPKMRRSYLLEINGMVIGGQLQTTWTYSENAHKRSSVENLATLYSQALKRLIEASQVNARGAFIASYPVEVEFGEEWG
jgi:non-ribosomal peptide synthase protein (TIGR01720 family)